MNDIIIYILVKCFDGVYDGVELYFKKEEALKSWIKYTNNLFEWEDFNKGIIDEDFGNSKFLGTEIFNIKLEIKKISQILNKAER